MTFLQVPANTKEEWEKVSREFSQKWNFHGCCGAILMGSTCKWKRPLAAVPLFIISRDFITLYYSRWSMQTTTSCKYVNVGANGSANDSTFSSKSTFVCSSKQEYWICLQEASYWKTVLSLSRHGFYETICQTTLYCTTDCVQLQVTAGTTSSGECFRNSVMAVPSIFRTPIELKLSTVDELLC